MNIALSKVRVRETLLILIALGSMAYALLGKGPVQNSAKQSTEGQSAPVKQGRIYAEARLVTYPGRDVTVGSDIPGTLEAVLANENDAVSKGQVIARIRAEDLKAELKSIEARLREAEADARLAETELERSKTLFEHEYESRQGLDRAERNASATRARVTSTAADIVRLNALIDKTVIVTPIAGTVISRFTHAGETITAGSPIVRVADLSRTRLEAEVDEYDGLKIKVGNEALVMAEGHKGQWRGVVEEIPSTMSRRTIRPPDPSKPVDTRVLLVKIKLLEATPLKLGQRAEVQIYSLR